MHNMYGATAAKICQVRSFLLDILLLATPLYGEWLYKVGHQREPVKPRTDRHDLCSWQTSTPIWLSC